MQESISVAQASACVSQFPKSDRKANNHECDETKHKSESSNTADNRASNIAVQSYDRTGNKVHG